MIMYSLQFLETIFLTLALFLNLEKLRILKIIKFF